MTPEEILEILPIIYDDYIDKDEFQINRNITKINKHITETDDAEIYFITMGKEYNHVSVSYIPSKMSFSITRKSMIQAGDLSGELSYTLTGLFFKNRDIDTLSYDDISNLIRSSLDEYYREKHGFLGEIIMSACKRILKIDSYEYLAKFPFEIEIIKSNYTNEINSYVIYYWASRGSKLESNWEIEHIEAEKVLDSEFLRKYSDPTLNEVVTTWQEKVEDPYE